MIEHRFAVGQSVLWRSRPAGAMGFVLAANVMLDDTMIALYQPPGAPTRRRLGARGGPSGRNLLVDEWDGRHHASTFGGPPVVRAYLPGSSYSIIRRWNPQHNDFSGWYINLERPWTRTALGFDSEDFLLDIVFAEDRSTWTVKDEDELAWAVETGTISAELSATIRRAGDQAISDSASNGGVFGIDWSTITPNRAWSEPFMPTNWSTET